LRAKERIARECGSASYRMRILNCELQGTLATCFIFKDQ